MKRQKKSVEPAPIVRSGGLWRRPAGIRYDHEFCPAIDAREQVRRWDNGASIWTIEMGGMGPGYEQAIQVLAVEICRDNLDRALIETREWGLDTVERIDTPRPDGKYACGGFSGAQVGAARWLAWQWLTKGPAALYNDPRYKDRHIQASTFWPHVERPPNNLASAKPNHQSEPKI